MFYCSPLHLHYEFGVIMLLAVWLVSMVVYWGGDSVGFDDKCILTKDCVIGVKIE